VAPVGAGRLPLVSHWVNATPTAAPALLYICSSTAPLNTDGVNVAAGPKSTGAGPAVAPDPAAGASRVLTSARP